MKNLFGHGMLYFLQFFLFNIRNIQDSNFSFQGGFPGQMPGGMGGQMPGGGNFDFQKMFNDPEFMKKFANMQQPQGGSDQSGQSDKKPTNQGEEPKVFEVPTDDLD